MRNGAKPPSGPCHSTIRSGHRTVQRNAMRKRRSRVVKFQGRNGAARHTKHKGGWLRPFPEGSKSGGHHGGGPAKRFTEVGGKRT